MTSETAPRSAGVDNVELYQTMPRTQLIDTYRASDVPILHLGAHDAIEKVVPSKLFEYAALGKPVLAGVSGHAAQVRSRRNHQLGCRRAFVNYERFVRCLREGK